ncbi:hypothetical protein HS088_TW03G00121 [Tripterygium wilfordii]|uniref:Uncharacterized protein n=1 Tax=Tripterygium wilfordii TaxID=458696 RepID=A0A7J7DUI9_TRIWF|nr:hypothetical protein HS088_TW03G00121 [Tripterygium wilfordii]
MGRTMNEHFDIHLFFFFLLFDAGIAKVREACGRTQGKMLASLPAGVKLTVEFDDHHRPIGRHMSHYATMQGLVIRNKEFTPLGYKSWLELPGENKNKMVQEVLKKFEIGDVELRVKYW